MTDKRLNRLLAIETKAQELIREWDKGLGIDNLRRSIRNLKEVIDDRKLVIPSQEWCACGDELKPGEEECGICRSIQEDIDR